MPFSARATRSILVTLMAAIALYTVAGAVAGTARTGAVRAHTITVQAGAASVGPDCGACGAGF